MKYLNTGIDILTAALYRTIIHPKSHYVVEEDALQTFVGSLSSYRLSIYDILDETEQINVLKKFSSFILLFCIHTDKLVVLRDSNNALRRSRAPAALSCELFSWQPRKFYGLIHDKCDRLCITHTPAAIEEIETEFPLLCRYGLPICYAKSR